MDCQLALVKKENKNKKILISEFFEGLQSSLKERRPSSPQLTEVQLRGPWGPGGSRWAAFIKHPL